MKKYLLGSVAVLLLSVTAAVAGSTTWIKLDNSSDYFAITRQGDTYAQMHYRGDLTVGGGVGMAAITHDEGKSVLVTDVEPGVAQYVCYNFSRPFVSPFVSPQSHGTWVAYATSDGKAIQDFGSGTYTVLPGNPFQAK